MIELYTAATPNGQKIHIMLEELGLPYQVVWVSISKGDQFKPEFLKISPNNKVPAIVDHDGPDGRPISVFESGAILLYLAEKTGRFLPTDDRQRFEVLEWLCWQMGGFGPMLGQAHHFNAYAPVRIRYAMERYTNEAGRLYHVLDKQLADLTGFHTAWLRNGCNAESENGPLFGVDRTLSLCMSAVQSKAVFERQGL